MKNLKKIMALVIIGLVIVFGALVMAQEKVFSNLGEISFADRFTIGMSILYLLNLVIDICLIVIPVINLFFVIFDKKPPYSSMVNCALIVVSKYLFSIFIWMLMMIVWGADGEYWVSYLFKDNMAIIPLGVFLVGFIFILASGKKSLEGTMGRAIAVSIGSGLTVFGLIFYFVKDAELDKLAIFGLVVIAIALLGLIVYSFLPQTREYKE